MLIFGILRVLIIRIYNDFISFITHPTFRTFQEIGSTPPDVMWTVNYSKKRIFAVIRVWQICVQISPKTCSHLLRSNFRFSSCMVQKNVVPLHSEKKNWVTITVKPKPIMKMNVSTLTKQTREFILRLFVESTGSGSSIPSHSFYTCSRCGTYARLHQ